MARPSYATAAQPLTRAIERHMQLALSVFASDKDTNATRVQMSWEDLCSSLSKPRPADIPKDRLPMWSPATFTGDARCAANVEGVACMVFDVDEDPVPSLEDIARAFTKTRWFAHSSSRSTLLAPRWRLVVELPRPVTREEHANLWPRLVQKLGFPVGLASKDASRAWYGPRTGPDGSFAVGGG